MLKLLTYKDGGLLVGRVLLGLIFLYTAYGKFGNIEGVQAYLASGGFAAPVFLSWVVTFIELIGGLMIVLGFHARWGALVMAIYLLIAALTFHLDIGNPAQTTQFFKNLAMIGGLIYLMYCGSGKYMAYACKCCK